MSHASRSAAESDAIRASHSRLMNHFLKEDIGSEPPASLSTRRESMTKGSSRCNLEPIMFQNLFNHLHLTDLAVVLDYSVCCLSWKTYLGSRFPTGTISAIIRFTAPEGEIAFDAHMYLLPDRSLGASGMIDPKAIYIQRRYHFTPVPL